MKKILLLILVLLMSGVAAFANSIDSVINKSKIAENSVVSVSLRNLNTGKVVYENDSHKLLNPASTLKAFTTPVIMEQLGTDYYFKTQIYKAGNNIYLKLSGNPLLNSNDLKTLVSSIRKSGVKNVENFYIDDTAFDNIEYGIGWMWDDEIISLIPKYSVYNLNGNLFTLKAEPSEDKKSVIVKAPYEYSVIVDNKLKYGTKNDILIARNFWDGAEKVTLSGTVNLKTKVSIPTFNQRRYFISSLRDTMNSLNITYYGDFNSKSTPKDAVLLAEVVNSVSEMYPLIMENSNNMVSESLFKAAGGKFLNSTGTTLGGIQAFMDYYKKLGVDVEDIIIVDASGVSRNDLLTADWQTNALYKINKSNDFNYKEKFNIPNRGTMKNRLFELRDYLWAKTGTLANISGITGYINTKNGNEYAFSILIQNTNKPIENAKKLEDEIIKTIYNKY